MTKNKLPDLAQDNDLFSIKGNKLLDCYDFILKKASYQTSEELAGVLGWVHQLGVNHPEVKIRIGAMVEVQKAND